MVKIVAGVVVLLVLAARGAASAGRGAHRLAARSSASCRCGGRRGGRSAALAQPAGPDSAADITNNRSRRRARWSTRIPKRVAQVVRNWVSRMSDEPPTARPRRHRARRDPAADARRAGGRPGAQAHGRQGSAEHRRRHGAAAERLARGSQRRARELRRPRRRARPRWAWASTNSCARCLVNALGEEKAASVIDRINVGRPTRAWRRSSGWTRARSPSCIQRRASADHRHRAGLPGAGPGGRGSDAAAGQRALRT